ARNSWPLNEPVDGYLCHSSASFICNFIQCIHGIIKNFFVNDRFRNRTSSLGHTTILWQRLVTPILSTQSSGRKWRPNDGSDVLINPEWHQLPFVFSIGQRIIYLVRNIFTPAVPFRNR